MLKMGGWMDGFGGRKKLVVMAPPPLTVCVLCVSFVPFCSSPPHLAKSSSIGIDGEEIGRSATYIAKL